MAEMLVRVNEKMDKLLKMIDKKSESDEILKSCSLLITEEVYKQWKQPKVITHDQKMEMQEGEVEDENTQ